MKHLISIALIATLAALTGCGGHGRIIVLGASLTQLGAHVELQCLAVWPRSISSARNPSMKLDPNADLCLGATVDYLPNLPDGSLSERDTIVSTSVRIPGAMLPTSMHASPRLLYYVVHSVCSGKTYASASTPNPVTCQ